MKVIQPREELHSYVRYYWTLKSDEPFRVLTFPIGCPQMIFHRGAPLYIPELSSRQNKFTVSGQVNFPAHIASDGNTALAQYDIDGAIGMYSGIFNNPFMIWGRYRRNWFKTCLTVSFQFHHTQMDGAHAARFLNFLQNGIKGLN